MNPNDAMNLLKIGFPQFPLARRRLSFKNWILPNFLFFCLDEIVFFYLEIATGNHYLNDVKATFSMTLSSGLF